MMMLRNFSGKLRGQFVPQVERVALSVLIADVLPVILDWELQSDFCRSGKIQGRSF